MSPVKLILLVASASLLAACNSTPTTSGASKAVLTQPSPAVTAELSRVISLALHGKKVAIAKDAFTHSHQLTLERNTQDPINQPGLNGRLMGTPVLHTFSLMQQRGRCYLIAEKTGKSYSLKGVDCKGI